MNLYVFDFDDTLAITDSMIKLIRNGKEIYMTSHEFAGYRAKPGDQLDFSDFHRVGGNLIEDTADELEKAIKDVGIDNVFIVTARSIATPVTAWLNDRIGSVPKVIATEGSPGKAPWLLAKLQTGNYTGVTVYEDCQKNIRMLKQTIEDYNVDTGSNVAYIAMCILSDQTMVKVEHRWRDENVITEKDIRKITKNFVRRMWK